MQRGVIYYRYFNFDDLEYDSPCCSHLGVMRNYLPNGLKIQFPKLRIHKIMEAELLLSVKKGSPGYNFLKTLEQYNIEHAPQKRNNMKHVNVLNCNSDYSIIYMKIKPDTLFFSEKNELISLSDIKSQMNTNSNIMVVCISNSPGLWSNGNSYGNTWNIEQLKVYIE
tara:strand:+ start:1272 stop:1772 length:501 start_codon:yes stop_codon:yes gene_type:complete